MIIPPASLLRHPLRCLWLACAFLCATGPVAGAQQRTSLSGFVTDAATGESLIAANIFIAEIDRGASTNASGFYAIADLGIGQFHVRCTFVGYQTVQLQIELSEGEQRRMDIQLKPASKSLGEVIVSAAQMGDSEVRNIGVSVLDPEAIKMMPAVIEPDVLRSLQRLPGVAAVSDYSSGLYVRGGDAGQTHVYFDRTRIYNPGHVLGFFSKFNPDVVKDVRLFKGGYPASFGGSLGSVLEIRSKDGNRNESSIGVGLGLLASRVIAEGPHPIGSYMFAARRSTFEPLLSALSHKDNLPSRLYFYDLNGKVTLDISQNDIVTISAYRGADLATMDFFLDGKLDIRFQNEMVAGSWTHVASDRLLSNFTITTSAYSSTPRAHFGIVEVRQTNQIYDTALSADFQYYSSAKNDWELGIGAGQIIAPLQTVWDGTQRISWRRRVRYVSAYVQDTYRASHKWVFKAGVRGSYLEPGSHYRIEPRLSVEHHPWERVRLQAAAGRYYQFATLVTNGVFVGFDYWLTSGKGVQPAYGDQIGIGAKTVLASGVTLDAELYYRTMRDLFKPDPFLGDPAGLEYAEVFLIGRGWARGLELLLQRNRGRMHGFLAYTLSRTERTFPTINANSDGVAVGYPPKHDRPHDVSAMLTYSLGRDWTINAAFSYATGQAITEPAARFELHDSEWVSGSFYNVWILVSPGLNTSRLPPYHRLDLGASKAGTLLGVAEYELSVQVFNAYRQRNQWFVFYGENSDGEIVRTVLPQISIPLPSLSLNLAF